MARTGVKADQGTTNQVLQAADDESLLELMHAAERTAIISRLLDCSEEGARTLADSVHFKTYRPRTFLAHQGQMCDEFWLVIEGTIQLRANSADGQTTVISACGEGELVGTYDAKHNASFDTFAYTFVRALSVRAMRLIQIVDEHPDLGRGLARIFSGQLSIVLERLANRVTLSATGRFYRELLDEAGEQDRIEPPPMVSVLALSAQTTRETGSRAMSKLERRGIIQRTDDSLTIVSRRMLEELVV